MVSAQTAQVEDSTGPFAVAPNPLGDYYVSTTPRFLSSGTRETRTTISCQLVGFKGSGGEGDSNLR